jgi:hypothetical protein
MGAQQSTEMPKQKSLSSTIDYLAANYILTSNFKDLKNLTNPDYCKKLVILTADVIAQYLSITEIDYLKQRMEGNVESNIMAKDNIAYFNKDSLNKMDIKSDITKRRMCVSIAKYYVQIFHVFNAIAHTINPVYTWKDQFGSSISVDYEHKNDIPSGVQPTISKVNLCSARINALIKDKSILSTTSASEPITVSTNFCNMNTTKDGTSKILQNEPGIPELEKLYYDVYNYNTGSFTSMSDDMKKQYNNDLQAFYTLFTGNENMPSNITKFGQIPLRDFKKIGACKNNGPFTKSYTGTLKDKLFNDYSENITQMMNNTEETQNALLKIIDQLFVYISNPQDPNKKLIVIHPKLTSEMLTKLVAETRSTIIKLYTTCEQDFFKGLQIFEAIVEKQVLDTSIAQIKRLQSNVEETISVDPNNSEAVKQVLANTPAPVLEATSEPAKPSLVNVTNSNTPAVSNTEESDDDEYEAKNSEDK